MITSVLSNASSWPSENDHDYHCSFLFVFSVFNVRPMLLLWLLASSTQRVVHNNRQKKRAMIRFLRFIQEARSGIITRFILLPDSVDSSLLVNHSALLLFKARSAAVAAEWEYKSTTLLYSNQILFWVFLQNSCTLMPNS